MVKVVSNHRDLHFEQHYLGMFESCDYREHDKREMNYKKVL